MYSTCQTHPNQMVVVIAIRIINHKNHIFKIIILLNWKRWVVSNAFTIQNAEQSLVAYFTESSDFYAIKALGK